MRSFSRVRSLIIVVAIVSISLGVARSIKMQQRRAICLSEATECASLALVARTTAAIWRERLTNPIQMTESFKKTCVDSARKEDLRADRLAERATLYKRAAHYSWFPIPPE